MATKQMNGLPSLNSQGMLDPGIYTLSLDGIEELFGKFQKTEQRLQLFARFKQLVAELKGAPFAYRLIVDGSFTTSKDEPSDIDLILVVASETLPIVTDLTPFEYNLLSSRRLRRKYGFDVLVAPEGSDAYERFIDFFARVKDGPPESKKGMVLLELQ